ncbi:MAG: hypothetical protein QNJ14_04000 [Woeseiaceae bacterium]|nr:hypothetical protein [Woeseiaceae bacterium]
MNFSPVFAFVATAAFLLLSACQNPNETDGRSSTDGPSHKSIEHIVDKNSEALGGKEALDRVATMVKRSRIVEGDYRDIAVFATDRLGRMRVDIFADGERVFAESYDGEDAYQWRPKDGQSTASQSGTVALAHTPQLPNHIFRLKDVAANGHVLELLGHEEVDETKYSVLKLTLSDGFENYLWVDVESGLVTRVRNTRALHVDIDDEEKVIESRISDFRRVGDIVHPHRVLEVDLKTGETLVDVTLLSMDLNVELAGNYFRDLIREVPEAE